MGLIRPDIGSQMVALCAALLLVTCFAIVSQRRLSACVDLFALQSAFLAATAALVAFLTGPAPASSEPAPAATSASSAPAVSPR